MGFNTKAVTRFSGEKTLHIIKDAMNTLETLIFIQA